MERLILGVMVAALAASPALTAAASGLGTLPTLDRKDGEGCWVRFFEDPGFKHPMTRVPGPLYINSISAPGLIGMRDEEEFFAEAGSVLVGPEAKLVVYAEPGFRDELFTLEPGKGVDELRALGFPDKVASLKIICERRR